MDAPAKTAIRKLRSMSTPHCWCAAANAAQRFRPQPRRAAEHDRHHFRACCSGCFEEGSQDVVPRLQRFTQLPLFALLLFRHDALHATLNSGKRCFNRAFTMAKAAKPLDASTTPLPGGVEK